MTGQSLVAISPTLPVRDVMRQLAPQLGRRRALIVVVLAVSVALPAIQTVEIWLFQRVVDEVLVPVDPWALLPIAVLYLGLGVLSGALGWIDEYATTWLREHLSFDLRQRMLSHLYRLPADVTDRQRAGDLLTRLTSDARSAEALLLGLVDGVGTTAKIVFFTGALLLLDWQLALVSFVVAPFFWWAASRFARRIKQVSREKRRRSGSMTAVAEEGLAVLPLVQIHGREADQLARFDAEGRAVVAAELSASRLRATYPLVVDLLELAGLLSVIALGTWALSEQRLTLGGLLVFLTYLSSLVRPLRDLGDLGVELASALAGTERVLELLALPTGVSDAPDVLPDTSPGTGHLHVQAVRFTYPGAPSPAVDGASLLAQPGDMVVLAGPSGSGKSTLVRLLGRLNDPDTGAVLLDGVDLRRLPLADVRRTVSILLQEAPVLDASVRDNVRFGHPTSTDAQVWQALREAGVAETVARLPGGLEARLGQRGRLLSGGQRQRIALARALLADARVLVLDEPTTGLDSAAAAHLVETLRVVSTRRTVIVASHDPLVQAAADRVVTLRQPVAETVPR